MAERDMGSTFLLPHSHLYKTEKVNIFASIGLYLIYKMFCFF